MLTKSNQLVIYCLPTYSRRMPDLHAHGAVLEVQGRRCVNSTAKILYQLAHCNGHVSRVSPSKPVLMPQGISSELTRLRQDNPTTTSSSQQHNLDSPNMHKACNAYY